MIIGAPNIGVIAFSGKAPVSPGITDTMLQIRAIKAPMSIVKGNRDL